MLPPAFSYTTISAPRTIKGSFDESFAKEVQAELLDEARRLRHRALGLPRGRGRHLRPYYGEAIAYQRVPTFRVQVPGNLSVGEFHRDKDYNHTEQEINWWVPLTPAYESNTVWLETEPDKGDYFPCAMEPGEILVFSG